MRHHTLDELMIDAALAHEDRPLVHRSDGGGIHLAADPIRLFQQQHGRAQPRRLHRRAEAPRPGASDDYVVLGQEVRGWRRTIRGQKRRAREQEDEQQ